MGSLLEAVAIRKQGGIRSIRPSIMGTLMTPSPDRAPHALRLHKAADHPGHISNSGIDGRVCAIGCLVLSPCAVAEQASRITLVWSTFSHRHAPHSWRPRQPPSVPCCPLGRPATADRYDAQAGGASDPPPFSAPQQLVGQGSEALLLGPLHRQRAELRLYWGGTKGEAF